MSLARIFAGKQAATIMPVSEMSTTISVGTPRLAGIDVVFLCLLASFHSNSSAVFDVINTRHVTVEPILAIFWAPVSDFLLLLF